MGKKGDKSAKRQRVDAAVRAAADAARDVVLGHNDLSAQQVDNLDALAEDVRREVLTTFEQTMIESAKKEAT